MTLSPSPRIYGAMLALCGAALGQTDSIPRLHLYDISQYVSALAGYTGGSAHYLEAGVAWNEYGGFGHHPSVAKAVYLSGEIQAAQSPVIAGKLGGWLSSGGPSPLAVGLSALLYTDMDRLQLRVRPEVGFGAGPFKIVYGFNPRLFGPVIPSIGTHVLNVAIAFPIKTLKRTIRD